MLACRRRCSKRVQSRDVSVFPSPAGFDALSDLLKPTLPTHPAPPPPQVAVHPGGKLLANDLDSSLANLVGSECPHAHV